MTVISFTGK